MLLNLLITTGLLFGIPPLCRRLHVPAIVGFIVAGMLVGPSGLSLIASTEVITALGKLGILFILFQSGSEMDRNIIHFQRHRALVYGLYSFCFPFALGVVAGLGLLSLPWLPSLLLGAMFGSHTLMTYPIVTRYGVQKTRSVSIVVGGTVLAMTLSLLVLAGVESQAEADFRWQRMLLIPLAVGVIVWLFPRMAHKFLRRHTEPVSTFLFVLLLMVLSAFLCEEAGLDGILGAFLCGVSLNRLLPSRSSLMRQVSFVGNSTLVPMFLMSVGMLCDVRVFAQGWQTLLVALVMIGSKLAGKWLAAAVVARQWRFSATERRLMFALTHASSAGTLAIATIGFAHGIFSVDVLNASVIMVLVLCTLSSFITEQTAHRLALQEEAHMDADRQEERWQLIALRGSEAGLRELATAAQLPHADMLCMKEWTDIQTAIEHQTCSMAVYQEYQPLNTVLRLRVIVPRYAEKERDFISCFGFVRRLSVGIGARVIFYSNEAGEQVLRRMCQREGKQLAAEFVRMNEWSETEHITGCLRDNDMLVLLCSRPSTAGYDPRFKDIPLLLSRNVSWHSYAVVYPEQLTGEWEGDRF